MSMARRATSIMIEMFEKSESNLEGADDKGHDMGDDKKIEVVKKTEAMSRKVTGAQSESHSCRPRKFI